MFFRCTRLRCFQTVSEESRQNLLTKFNSLSTKNEQDGYLTGLISFYAPTRRRPRRLIEETFENEHSDDNLNAKKFANNAVYSYKVRVTDKEISVCLKAFLSIFGISRGRIRRIQEFMIQHGYSPRDRRGIYENRPNKLPREVETLVV